MKQTDIEAQVRKGMKETIGRMNSKERAIAQQHPEWIEESIQQRIKEEMSK